MQGGMLKDRLRGKEGGRWGEWKKYEGEEG